MKTIVIYTSIILLFTGISSCANGTNPKSNFPYILKIPENPKGLVVIFPSFGYGCVETDNDTKIDEAFYKDNYASLIINFNNDLYLDETNFKKLNSIIKDIIDVNDLPDNMIIGGFSAGGNIALSYGIWSEIFKIKLYKPKTIFVGDSPVDLLSLYNVCESKISENKNQKSEKTDENRYLINFLNVKLGNPKDSLSNYYKYSPFVNQDIEKSNLRYLVNYNILFFSEPDLQWYKNNRDYDYEDTNSYKIRNLYSALNNISNRKIQYIKTTGKGYRENGERNPHSWSIIDPFVLVDWIEKRN